MNRNEAAERLPTTIEGTNLLLRKRTVTGSAADALRKAIVAIEDAAKAEGAWEAVERIRVAVKHDVQVNDLWTDYRVERRVLAILDEEAAR